MRGKGEGVVRLDEPAATKAGGAAGRGVHESMRQTERQSWKI